MLPLLPVLRNRGEAFWFKSVLCSESGLIDAWIVGSVLFAPALPVRTMMRRRDIGSSRSAQYTQSGPPIGYRIDSVRPLAKIVLEADSHDQLDSILFALSRSSLQNRKQSKNMPRIGRAKSPPSVTNQRPVRHCRTNCLVKT